MICDIVVVQFLVRVIVRITVLAVLMSQILDVVLFQALGRLEYLRDVIGIEGRLVSHRYTYLPACAAPVVPHTVMEV